MSDDALSFLEDTPQPQPVEAAPQPEPAPAIEDQGEPSAVPPTAPEPHRDVPLTALLDEREKRQQAAREAEELRRELAALKAQAQPQPKPIDVLEDPEGFARQQQMALQSAILQDRYERSRWQAEEKHGAETVKAVIDFFNDPAHAPKSQEFIRHPDPFAAAFRYYTEQQEVAKVRASGGLDAIRQQLEAEIREKVLAELQQSSPQKPATPPPSLASAASSGTAKAPPINGFDAAFGA